jgi:hypothetical protein
MLFFRSSFGVIDLGLEFVEGVTYSCQIDGGFKSRVKASINTSNHKILTCLSCFLVELHLPCYIVLNIAILVAKIMQHIICFSASNRRVLSESGRKLLAP